ncbi:hypothetical protein, partial [Vibrio parahaemolyticus]|uniref:hypothetical protein n=1 Tax=Vibrio parahaemolyticus TaxID=670 RepID=UPI0021138F73
IIHIFVLFTRWRLNRFLIIELIKLFLALIVNLTVNNGIDFFCSSFIFGLKSRSVLTSKL